MSVPPFPAAYARRMRAQLGGEADAYFAAMEQPSCRGLRQNPQKSPDRPLSAYLPGLRARVPWQSEGWLLPPESRAGAHPLHEAGAYYLQEPSAMLPAMLLAAAPGEKVLDLCAAPGGKSTQLAAAMAGRGLLVANEIVPSRAQVLSRNLERMGVTNALAVCADPERLAAVWPQFFDAVLVDAPCSGEGMFRRHPETRLEWDEGAPVRCAVRQQLILESACAMLKAGGRLCYSTCTFSREENEDVVASLLAGHPELTPVPFSVPVSQGRSIASIHGCVRLSPQEVAGEGQFAALLVKTARGKTDTARETTPLPAARALAAPDRMLVSAFNACWLELAEGQSPVPNAILGELLLSSPDLPPLSGVRVLRAGLALGRLKGRVFVPDHALALAAPPFILRSSPLSAAQAALYLAGETLPAPDGERGYSAAMFASLPLGFVKASDGLLKNHYPKGLRRTVTIVRENEGGSYGEE
jgi:16S rRNA C967 or C1407 C5-methylase (RsmB/RsmF family)/NOL1/NOP2/fmu family ribosome biogenesis protein